MLEFKFHDEVTFARLTVGAEGEDLDNSVIEIKVTGQAPGTIAGDLFGCADNQAAAFWYLDTEDQVPVFNGISKIKVGSVFKDVQVKIGTIGGGKVYKGCIVRRFTVKPINNRRFEVECFIKFQDLNANQAGALCKLCKHQTALEILGQPDIFDGEKKDDAA